MDDLDKLEMNALALRKLADTVLEQARAAKKKSASAQSRKAKQIESAASVKARILAGSLKSSSARKKKPVNKKKPTS